MADKTILELTDIGALQGGDILPIAREGVEADNGTTVGAIADFAKGTSEDSQSGTYTLTPSDRDKLVKCGTLTALTIALPQESSVGVPQNSVATIEFTSGSTATVLTYDSSEISFAGGDVPDIEANGRYLISVYYDTAVCVYLNSVSNQ